MITHGSPPLASPAHAAPSPAALALPWYLRAVRGVRRWASRRLGPLWLPRHLTAPFPGVVAHHRPAGLAGLVFGHARAFHEATVIRGEQASSYFRSAGVAACAERHGGLCSFRMGRTVALYQIDNAPLIDDEALAPSLDLNRELFGDFLGSQPTSHPARHGKRHAIEASLGSARFIDELEPALRGAARTFLARAAGGAEVPVDEFARDLVAYVDSVAPGVLDLTRRPLTEYLASAAYGRIARAFFDIASDVISKVHPDAIEDLDAIVPFVRALLTDNADAIASAPPTNLILRHFALWGRPFSRGEIDRLSPGELKELGTVIVATYDTTCLSLAWTIGYIERDPALKRDVVDAASRPPAGGALSLLDLVVLEAVRLGGSNPTALWRRVVRPFVLRRDRRSTTVPAGVMLWLDRRLANQDPAVFPRPGAFDVGNVRAILRSPRETFSSLLSRNRYEINSFSMVNTERNPRKCPGRLFSVRQQSILLGELYAAYDVAVHGVDLRLKDHSSMPRPARPGAIRITPRARRSHPGAIP
jgi:cytochrome P450